MGNALDYIFQPVKGSFTDLYWFLYPNRCYIASLPPILFRTRRRTLESPLDSKEIKSVNPKGNQPWIFIGRTDAEAETPLPGPPAAKSRLIGKDPDAGKDWRQEEKGMTEDEMVGWHHWLKGDEFERVLGDIEGQGSLAWGSPWGCKESDTTERLSSNHKMNQ